MIINAISFSFYFRTSIPIMSGISKRAPPKRAPATQSLIRGVKACSQAPASVRGTVTIHTRPKAHITRRKERIEWEWLLNWTRMSE